MAKFHVRADQSAPYVRDLAAALQEAGHALSFGAGAPPNGAVLVVDAASAPAPGAVGLIHDTAPLASANGERLSGLRRIVTPSEAVRDRLVKQHGVDARHITVLLPGTAPAERSAGPSAEICQILSPLPDGRETLLAALTRLLDLPWRLVLLGEAPAAADAAVEARILRAGAATDDVWAQTGLFAFTPSWADTAAPVAEAIRHGIPPAVTNGGAAAELVPPEAGVVVHPGEAEQLSKAIRRIIYDRSLRTEMADAAWAIGRSLPSWTEQAARFAEWATT